jgi:hypothetical protein
MAGLVGIGALAVAQPAGALSISIDSAALGGSNTADDKFDNLGSNFLGETGEYSENRSSLSTLNAGGAGADTIGSSVSAATRYAAVIAADTGQNNNINRTAVSNYSITFTVTAAPTAMYDLTIDTSRIGTLTKVDDGSATARRAIATMGAVSGTVDAVAEGALGLPSLGFDVTVNASTDDPFNQSNQLVISNLTGTHTITLSFTWTSFVELPNATIATGNDEVAVRLGMAGTQATRVSAEDYPGVGSRVIGNDGHFVNISAEVTNIVPEPGTFAMLGLGLAGIARAGRRRAN